MKPDRICEVIWLNFANVTNQTELHQLFFDTFDFPAFYGFNWNALWDTITSLIVLPDKVYISNFAIFEAHNYEDAAVFTQFVADYNTHMVGKTIEIIAY